MSLTTAKAEALRNALFYANPANPYQRSVAEYRTVGGKTWKLLPFEARYFNAARYEYRVSTRRLWIENGVIQCSAGGIYVRDARRILEILKKRRRVYAGGYTARYVAGGGIEVGCQTFSKADVAYARQLLAA